MCHISEGESLHDQAVREFQSAVTHIMAYCDRKEAATMVKNACRNFYEDEGIDRLVPTKF